MKNFKPILFFPVIALLVWRGGWVIESWRYSPLDKFGPLYALGALVLLFSDFRSFLQIRRSLNLQALFILSVAIVSMGIAVRININFIFFLAGLLTLSSLVWLLYGWNAFLRNVPIFGLSVLALPEITYFADLAILTLFNRPLFAGEWLKVGTGFLFTCQFIAAKFYQNTKGRPLIRPHVAAYLLGVSAVVLLMILMQKHEITGPAMNLTLDKYSFKNWVGDEAKPTVAEKGFYQHGRMRKMIFFNPQGAAVTLMVVSSKTDIHDLHPPEYCLIGSGWTVLERSTVLINSQHPGAYVMRIKTQHQNENTLGYYWFSSEQLSTPSHFTFRKAARNTANKEWRLYRIQTSIIDKDDTVIAPLMLGLIAAGVLFKRVPLLKKAQPDGSSAMGWIWLGASALSLLTGLISPLFESVSIKS